MGSYVGILGAGRGKVIFRVLALCCFSGACVVEEWRNADVHLDVIGSDLHDEDRVRICVEGIGNREQALGAGRLAFSGLPLGSPVVVVVDALGEQEESRRGRVGPVELDEENPWAEAVWNICEDGCQACAAEGELVREGDGDWLLGIRFLE